MRKTFKKLISTGLIVVSIFAFTSVASALPPSNTSGGNFPSNTSGSNTPSNTSGSSDCNGLTTGTGISNPLKGGCSLYNLIELVINNVVLPIGGVIVVFFIIYSGYLLVVSAGNEEKVSKAKKAITYTLIGAAILLGSWVISTAIKNTIEQITVTPQAIPNR
ncbi:MAG: pilin [Candidatus Taylorbacteria bacterium]